MTTKINLDTTWAVVYVKFPPMSYDKITIGALTLSVDGREYIWDAFGTNLSWGEEDKEDCQDSNGNILYISFESECHPDIEVFSECPYDLTVEDLSNPDLVATFFTEGFCDITEATVEATVFIHDGISTVEYPIAKVIFED
jgi:hypothetical protein